MIITTKKIAGSLNNIMDLSARASQTSASDNSDSELLKSYNRSNSNKSEDFKRVLNSKTVSKEKDTQKVDEENNDKASIEVNDGNVDKLNEKLEKLEESSKSDSKDTANDVLEELLNLLAQFGIKKEDLKVNGQINQDILKNLLNKITKEQCPNEAGKKIDELVMKKLDEFLKKDSLKTINNILSNLSTKLSGDKSETAKNVQKLMSEISNVLDNKQSQTGKVLNLEEMLSKNYSQSDNNTSTDDEANKNTTSKEDKFLNSLIDDKKDDSLNKINIFASRTAAIQNQGVNTTRGLTINKGTLVEDLIKDVKFMSNNSLKELTVKVNPGNLGEITIKLVQEDGIMKANLKANSKETTALLSQNLADIKKQLSEQNIKVSDVNIELYQDDTTFFKEQGFEGQFAGDQNKQNSNSQNRTASTQGVVNEELNENSAEENNNVNFFA